MKHCIINNYSNEADCVIVKNRFLREIYTHQKSNLSEAWFFRLIFDQSILDISSEMTSDGGWQEIGRLIFNKPPYIINSNSLKSYPFKEFEIINIDFYYYIYKDIKILNGVNFIGHNDSVGFLGGVSPGAISISSSIFNVKCSSELDWNDLQRKRS